MSEKTHPRAVFVKDRGMVRQMFSRIMREELGLAVVAECDSYDEGKEVLLRQKPDLVIVDLMLLDGHGFDLIRDVGPKLAQLRWLFLSAVEHGYLVREAVRLGVQGFVMKCADLATLREAVQRLLAGEMYYCPASARLLVENMVGMRRIDGTILSPRECEVLRGFASGENAKALAGRLGVSGKTVQNHLGVLRVKLGLHEPAELVHYALRNGYIDPPSRWREEPLVDRDVEVAG